ncbi:MAG: hypothetical protein H6839_17970 [Planctomycetes bacterium]|nr:hypothetical protein [Planctomycetota bacterium]
MRTTHWLGIVALALMFGGLAGYLLGDRSEERLRTPTPAPVEGANLPCTGDVPIPGDKPAPPSTGVQDKPVEDSPDAASNQPEHKHRFPADLTLKDIAQNATDPGSIGSQSQQLGRGRADHHPPRSAGHTRSQSMRRRW